jgi:hypothetical protein
MEYIVNLSLVHLYLTERPIVIFVIFISTMIVNYFFIATKNNKMVFLLFSVFWLCFGLWANIEGASLKLKEAGNLFYMMSLPIIILTFVILIEELKDNFYD